MTRKGKCIGIIILAVIMAISFTACSRGGGGRSFNSAAELKEYLDSQPANSPDKPIRVRMNVNDLMIQDVANAIASAGKFVYLDLTESTGLTTVGQVFGDNKALAGINLPNSITSIGRYAFSDTSLTSVTIPDSVTSIGEGAFYFCKNLSSVTIPNGITIIEDDAFGRCENLASIIIPNSVIRIARRAFRGTNLTNITIPASVTEIWVNAFSDCDSLTSVTFEGTSLFPSNLLIPNRDNPFDGDLVAKYRAGGAGTYTRAPGGRFWTKQ